MVERLQFVEDVGIPGVDAGKRPVPHPQPAETLHPARIGAPCRRDRLRIGIGHHHVAADADEPVVRLAEPCALRAIAVDDRAHLSRGPSETMWTSFSAGQSALGSDSTPAHSGGCGRCTGRSTIGTLRNVVLAREAQFVGRRPASGSAALPGRSPAPPGNPRRRRGLQRRHAAADAELEPPAAHLIEHADLLDQADRMVVGQEVDQRAEAQTRGALRDRGQEQSRARRRSRAASHGARPRDSRRSLRGRRPPRAAPIGVVLRERHARVVHVVEDAELHARLPAC